MQTNDKKKFTPRDLFQAWIKIQTAEFAANVRGYCDEGDYISIDTYSHGLDTYKVAYEQFNAVRI